MLRGCVLITECDKTLGQDKIRQDTLDINLLHTIDYIARYMAGTINIFREHTKFL